MTTTTKTLLVVGAIVVALYILSPKASSLNLSSAATAYRGQLRQIQNLNTSATQAAFNSSLALTF